MSESGGRVSTSMVMMALPPFLSRERWKLQMFSSEYSQRIRLVTEAMTPGRSRCITSRVWLSPLKSTFISLTRSTRIFPPPMLAPCTDPRSPLGRTYSMRAVFGCVSGISRLINR